MKDSIRLVILLLRGQVRRQDHPNVAIIMTHYGRMYHLKGDYARAEVIVRLVLEILRKSLPAGHPESAQTLVTLRIMLVGGGKSLEAEPYLREAMAIRDSNVPSTKSPALILRG